MPYRPDAIPGSGPPPRQSGRWPRHAFWLFALILLGTAAYLCRNGIFPAYIDSPRYNPLPNHLTFTQVVFHDPLTGQQFPLHPTEYRSLRKLFEGVQFDPQPAKWKKGVHITIERRDQPPIQIHVFDLGEHRAAVHIHGRYHRGGPTLPELRRYMDTCTRSRLPIR